jgi:hypothetical protein
MSIPKTKRDTLRGLIRLKPADLKVVRKELLDKQDWLCPLCQRQMKYIKPAQRCVDHDHAVTGPTAGVVRGVLCSNCNGNEGRIRRRVLCSQGHLSQIEWLENLLNYWKLHSVPQTDYLHHTHKTPDEKRLLKNAQARKRRAVSKKGPA